MTTAQITAREELRRVINILPDDGVVAMLNFAKNFRQLNSQSFDGSGGFYDEANVRWLKGSIEQLKQGRTVTKTIEELERMANE